MCVCERERERERIEKKGMEVNVRERGRVSTSERLVISCAQITRIINVFLLPQVTIQGEWAQWNNKVPKIEVETHKVGSPDIVVPTLDTVRHESLLYTWLAEHKPMVLCGPPGSGKTMTLFSALRALPDFEVRTCACTCLYYL